MRRYEAVGCAVSEILLPRPGIDFQKWAVVACDQFTSQPEYWREVEQFVGDAPSTLRMVFPEVYLGEPGTQERITSIRAAMRQALETGLLVPRDGLLYLERQVGRKTRRGVMICLDLEHYDYNLGSRSLIRATEGTILERLPPRIAIREGATLELPHIMVLIDDPADTVIGPLAGRKGELEQVYEFDLMQDSGHLEGYLVGDLSLERETMDALARLGQEEGFRSRYDLGEGEHPVLLYAMGDGNHSLATAKAIWEELKGKAGDRDAVMESPARYALVELVNIHDPALVFEPIHRVLFDIRPERDVLREMDEFFAGRLTREEVPSMSALQEEVDRGQQGAHRFGVVRADALEVVTVRHPSSNIAAGTLQAFLDGFMSNGGAREIDYVHDTEPVRALGSQPGNMGFYLPAMGKQDLFKSVILDGALPRKTFSMGEAREKRFYLECRRLA